MMELAKLRRQIDDLDQKIAFLIRERLELAVQIGQYKKLHQLGITHPAREKEVIQNFTSLAGTETEPVIRAIIACSKSKQ